MIYKGKMGVYLYLHIITHLSSSSRCQPCSAEEAGGARAVEDFMSHFIELSHPWQHPTQNRSCHQICAAKIVVFSYFIQNTKCTHNVFQSIYVKKDTTDAVWSCLHKSCKQRPEPRVTEVAWAGECTGCMMAFPSCFCTANAVWRKVIINNFFFQSGTHAHPGTGFCTQPTQVFAIHQGICKTMYCLMYIHIHYSRRQFPACRCPKGSTRIIHLLTSQGPASVPLSMLWVTMQVCDTCLPPPRAGDVNSLQSPRTRAFCKFPMNLLNVGHQDMQWRSGVGCPVWTLSQFLCLAPQAKGLRLHMLWWSKATQP